MKLTLLFSILFITNILSAQSTTDTTTVESSAHTYNGIEFFDGTWQEALFEARATKKLVFIDCYTSWCKPCIWMIKEVFTDKKVGDFFNKRFISLKRNMEKGEGRKLKKIYHPMSTYPTFLFLDDKGQVIKRKVGALDVDSFLELAKSVVK
ncbi:MAG: DUF255 domain-containing protein [Aureispira sp.]|nr:DUF255 domain-containing protein [Aureispira sp.]